MGCGCGGGRVSIVLTSTGEDFENWTGATTAYGGDTSHASVDLPAAAGTVYLEAATDLPSSGTVLVNNTTRSTNTTYTALPAFKASEEDIGRTRWVVSNSTRVALVTNVAVERLELNTGTTLELAGWTLNVRSMAADGLPVRSGVYTAADMDRLTDAVGGGKVIVPAQATVIIIQ
ncbi:hypothetical protein ACFLQU_05020 [Verrucomicrobiota bacterium]